MQYETPSRPQMIKIKQKDQFNKKGKEMSTETIQEMHRILELQKSCNIKDGAPDISVRQIDWIEVVAMVTKYDKEIIETVSQDFGNRDPMMSGVTEVQSVIGPMQHAKKNLKKWMKTEKRKAAIAPLGSALSWMGAKAEVQIPT